MASRTLFSFRKKLSALALAATAALVISTATTATVSAQDAGALLNVLVKKGVLTDQEAEDIRAEIQKDNATTAAGKLNVSPALSELKISGDVRARYEYRTGENGTGDSAERGRFRYRLRLGLTGKVGDGFFFGTRLETANGNRSTNVTEGDYVLAPFGKNTGNTVYVGQAYVGYQKGDFTITGGRFANPLITTPMVWDDDINVEGFAEQFSHTAGNVTYLANLAQLVYDGVGTYNAFGASPTRANTYLLAFQAGARIALAGGASFQFAPTYYGYSNAGAAFGALTTPNNAILQPRGLSILDIPLEYNFAPLGGELPLKIFGDIAYNFDADKRALAANQASHDNESLAYQIGVALGGTKNKGDWELRAFYQSVDAFALDSNLVDSDLFDSRTNMQGFGLSASYALSAGVTAKITYAYADRKNSDLPTYGAGDIATLNLTRYQLLQTDISIKF